MLMAVFAPFAICVCVCSTVFVYGYMFYTVSVYPCMTMGPCLCIEYGIVLSLISMYVVHTRPCISCTDITRDSLWFIPLQRICYTHLFTDDT